MAVYFIRNTHCGSIKIGVSSDPGRRMAGFQTGNPHRLEMLGHIPGGADLESQLHTRFAEFRLNGEWFSGTRGLVADIRDLIGGGPLLGRIEGRAIRRIYLAGKITGADWRTHLLGFDPIMYDCDPEFPLWPAAIGVGPAVIDYVGPARVDLWSGHGVFGPHAASTGSHGEFDALVVDRCKAAIEACDLFFAWLDSDDCHGTMAEIGFAVALGKLVAVATPNPDRDLWFTYRLADHYIEAASPKLALRELFKGHGGVISEYHTLDAEAKFADVFMSDDLLDERVSF